MVGAVVALAVSWLAQPGMSLAAHQSPLQAEWNSQRIQNRRADADHLSRMRNTAMVRRFARAGLLVRVPRRTRYYYTRFIPAKYRYLRPWSKLFLDRLARQHYARFRKKLRITSLVRTVALQRWMRRRNQNAAPSLGPRRSSHLTGATLDISKKGMSAREIAWMRRVLGKLKARGYLYAVEEFEQPTFHIMVFRNYPRYVELLKKRARRRKSD